MAKGQSKPQPQKSSSGAPANCARCGVLLQVAAARRADSKPFRRAAVPEGVCPDCVMTEFLYNTYPINWQIDQVGPELLLKPDFAEAAFVCSGLMDGCEMQIQEVNWQRVVENWKLPVKIDKKNPRNPYRMGDCHRDLCGQGLGFSRVDRPATAGPDPDAHLKHSLAGVLNAMQPRGPLSGGRPDHRAEGRDHRVPAETIERRREAVGILDELKAAGLIDYSLGADRADGTGPQLDVWTTRDTLLARTPAPSSLSKRAKTMWAMLLLGGLGSGGRNGK